MFQDVSGKQSQIVQQILNHPDFDKWGKSSAHEADPFVVALASYTNSTVVSYENPRKTKNTIPAACRFFKMNHFSFIEFLRNEKYKMG